jgi:hypothetical protein
VSSADEVFSVCQAAAVCNVTPPVVRRWLSLGLLTAPPWTRQQLHKVRDITDPQGRRRGPQAPHGTLTRWLEGCDCDGCREAQNEAARARFRRRAQERLPVEKRRQLLDCIYSGKPFRAALTDLGLTSNQVWGAYEDRRGMVGSARGSADSHPSKRPQARQQRRVRRRLCLQGMP